METAIKGLYRKQSTHHPVKRPTWRVRELSDFVCRLSWQIFETTMWPLGVLNILSPHDPPSTRVENPGRHVGRRAIHHDDTPVTL